MSDNRPTYEQAGSCPTCGKPGRCVKKQPMPRAAGLPAGTTLHSFRCESVLCPDGGEMWIVQVNPDGSIPPPRNHTGEPKIYEGFQYDDMIAQRIRDGLEMERALSQRPDGHGEVRR